MTAAAGDAAARARLNQRAAAAAACVAAVLVLLKLVAALQTGSVAMLGSLADTALDLLASGTTFVALWYAGLPADREHRFGHGKAEALSALFQTALILVSSVALAWNAAERLREGSAPEAIGFGIGVSLAASAMTVALLFYQTSVIRRTGSVAIRTDRLHYRSDLMLNLGVIAALAIEARTSLRGADAVVGLGIAVWLGVSAVASARHAVDVLMDREWDEERRQAILMTAATVPGVMGVHDLRTRSAGHVDFIQFHIWVAPQMTVAAAHDVVDAVEAAVRTRFAHAEVMIHVDPAGHRDRGLPPA